MRRFTVPTLLCCCAFAASASAAEVQLFAARTEPKTDPIVELQPKAPAPQPRVPAFATPERPPVQQAARTTTNAAAPAQTASVPAKARTSSVAATAENGATTFAAVTPAGAPPRPAAVQNLVRSRSTTFAPVTTTSAASAPAAKKQFTFTDPSGQVSTAEVLRGYRPNQIASPIAKIDPAIDPRLRRAATIAQERARASTRRRCWRYVKEALLASGVIDSYPKTVNAKEAGDELVRSYGFKKLPIRDPYAAPIGSVLVYYKGRNRPGHVELRTKDGFVSDFRSKTPDRHALLGVFAKRG